MKITIESKFEIGQTVYVVHDYRVVEAVIRRIEIDSWGDRFLHYTLHNKNFHGSTKNVYERDVYGSEQEAKVECNRQIENRINYDLQHAKETLCHCSRRWKTGDCQTETQKKILTLLRKTNDEIVRIRKAGGAK